MIFGETKTNKKETLIFVFYLIILIKLNEFVIHGYSKIALSKIPFGRHWPIFHMVSLGSK